MKSLQLSLIILLLIAIANCCTTDPAPGWEKTRQEQKAKETVKKKKKAALQKTRASADSVAARLREDSINTARIIQDMAYYYSHHVMDSTRIFEEDYTGDGVPEQVVARTYASGDSFITSHIMKDGDEVIYTDTLTFVNDGYYSWLPEESPDSFQKANIPYISFYYALQMMPLKAGSRASDLLDSDEEEDFTLRILTIQTQENKAIPEEDARAEAEKIIEYMRSFEGEILTTQTEGSDLKMWYAPEKRFITIYSP